MEKPKFTVEQAQNAIEWIRTSDACSYWLKDALNGCLKRDPVDAWKDVSLLENILSIATRHPLEIN